MKDASQVHEVQFEPCFQRKKKTEGPTTTLSFNFTNSDKTNDDYILLGKNTKFQENIKYKCRPIKPFEVTEANIKESSPNQKGLPESSPQANNEYILLGNNFKFANNIVYKPRSYQEVVIANDKDQEKPSKDGFDYAKEPKKILEEQESYNFNDDYILLGNNAKFSNNVAYKPKVWRDFNSIYDKEKENAPADDNDAAYFPFQAKILDPPPVIDTSKFREPPKKSKKAFEKMDDSEIKIKKKKSSSALHQEGAKEEMKLPLDDLPSVTEDIDGKTDTEKESTNAFKDENRQAVSSEKYVKFQSPPPAPRPQKEAQIQHNNDKKLLSLLHKAGIQLPPRPMTDLSEYQKNFTWKKPLPLSDTSSDNKKIFQSTTIFHTDSSHQDSIPKITEYQRNFQAWAPLPTKPAPPSDRDVQKEPKHHAAKLSKTEKPASSVSKNHQVNNIDQERASKEDQLDASSVASYENADKIRQENNVKRTESVESISSLTAKTKHEKHRESQCLNSEYRANFKAPSKYDYMTNAWYMNNSLNEDTQTPPKDNSHQGDWYSEVLDLRRKASEYRHRANNTHFSPDHMAQLLADETRLWERSKSDGSFTAKLDARRMRPAGISYSQYPPSAHYKQLPLNSHTASNMTLEDVTDDADVASVHSEPEADAICAPNTSETDVVPSALPGEINDETEEDAKEMMESHGRVPTPEFQKHNVRRHHLDRTTPIKGDLLISPVTNTNKIDSEVSNNPETAEPNDDIELHHSESDTELKPKHCVQTCALPSKNNYLQTFGKPSKDTHILRAQENILTKPPKKSSEISSNITMRSGNRRPKKSQVKQHPAGVDVNQAIPESMISIYNLELPEEVYTHTNDKSHLEEDFLSQSLESNNSLASEILERTRKRLNFW